MRGMNCPQFYVLLTSCEMRNERRSLIVSQNLLFVVLCQNQKMECFMKKKYSVFDEGEEAYKLKPLYLLGLVGYCIFFWKDIEK